MKRSGFKKPRREDYEYKPVAPRQKPKIAPGRTKLPKVKSRSQAKLKKLLDAVFSKYIRAIHPPVCYTCGKHSTPQNLQCGHFIPRQYLVTRWSEDNCRPQCVGCNIYGNGKPLDFEEHLKRDIGENEVEMMKMSRHVIRKLSTDWYEREIERYTKLLADLSTS